MTKISTQYTSTSYEYDKLDRIVFVVNRSGNATVYEYDANGNRSAVRYANGIVATNSYDSLNRLIKEKIVDKNGKNIAVYEYTLDKNGNYWHNGILWDDSTHETIIQYLIRS